jgi:hypothetical protein
MFTVKQIKAWDTTANINGKWVECRPLVGPLIERLRDAWAVLRGNADAIRWPEGQ